MSGKYDIGLEEALAKTFACLNPLEPVAIPVEKACGLVAAEDALALVDCPSETSSLKDGFGVLSSQLIGASDNNPIRLRIIGTQTAGNDTGLKLSKGEAIKLMTGAKIPVGCDAVIASEFTREENSSVLCFRDAAPGRNILKKGTDVTKDRFLLPSGKIITPAMTGLLAAGGIERIPVYPLPRIAILAIGDEVIAPGRKLNPGQLYASNLVTLVSWLKIFGLKTRTEVIKDREEDIESSITDLLSQADLLLTSGGAWKSERDLTTKVLTRMGGNKIFHRVRIGPGKAVALVIFKGKTIFCLPGGPPSNEMAFLQIALPAILHLSAHKPYPFKIETAHLARRVGGDINWTQFVRVKLEKVKEKLIAHPLKMESRIGEQAVTDGIVKVPEGVKYLEEGVDIPVQVF
ncbi:molybdopterin molybdotransferase MoeA [Candidatus Riflebacteria bacterium]